MLTKDLFIILLLFVLLSCGHDSSTDTRVAGEFNALDTSSEQFDSPPVGTDTLVPADFGFRWEGDFCDSYVSTSGDFRREMHDADAVVRTKLSPTELQEIWTSMIHEQFFELPDTINCIPARVPSPQRSIKAWANGDTARVTLDGGCLPIGEARQLIGRFSGTYTLIRKILYQRTKIKKLPSTDWDIL